MRFDAECDIASVVYTSDESPDDVIKPFAEDLMHAGLRLVGVVQTAPNCRSESPGLGVLTFPDRRVVGLISSGEPQRGGCRLDDARLDELSQRLAREIKAGIDLLIINRFGHSEAEGKGFIPLIERAFDADVPVLIAVSSRRFPDWIKFCKGMNVRLACRRDEIERWWSSVRKVPMPHRSSTQPSL